MHRSRKRSAAAVPIPTVMARLVRVGARAASARVGSRNRLQLFVFTSIFTRSRSDANGICSNIAGAWGAVVPTVSWPGLVRPSTTGSAECGKDVDGRHKAGHDTEVTGAAMLTLMRLVRAISSSACAATDGPDKPGHDDRVPTGIPPLQWSMLMPVGITCC